MELVSVIIPAYNVQAYLSRCIESILNQTYKNIEILICDDASTDDTWQVATRYQDRRIRAYRNSSNQGVAASRNFLLSKASGSIILLQDADDWSHEERILQQVNALAADGALLCCGTQYVKVDKYGKKIFESSLPLSYDEIRQGIPDAFPFLCASIAFRKNALERVGGYNTFFGSDGNEDIYFVARLVLAGKFENLSSHLYYYRLNEHSLTKLHNINNRRFYIHQITRELLRQQLTTGTNWLESNDMEELNRFERELAAIYERNPSLKYERLVGQFLYWKRPGMACRLALSNIIENGITGANLKLAAHCLRKSLFAR